MAVGVRAIASRARRKQILDTALELFLDKGVTATTAAELLERSHASVGSFYHHFEGKADVAAALYLEILESYERRLVEKLHKSRSAREGIEGTVREHLDWTRNNPKPARYLIHCREPEVAQLSEQQAHGLNRTFFAEVTKWLGGHARELRQLPSQICYALWMGPANEFTRWWLLESDRDLNRIKRAENLLAHAAWEALRSNSNAS
jgi:AcrR family transcriptional regulator